jgi:tetratricopeptide (TPR) repeat protein
MAAWTSIRETIDLASAEKAREPVPHACSPADTSTAGDSGALSDFVEPPDTLEAEERVDPGPEPSPSLSLPLGLRNALESAHCVLFLGAGVGANVTDKTGAYVPDAANLARQLVDHFHISEATEPFDLSQVAQIVEYRSGRPALDAFIKDRLSDLMPDEHVRWLTTIRWRAIFTTNYDLAILRAYELNPNPPQQPVAISATSELVHCDSRVDVPVYYLHGNIVGPDPNLIITQDDYARFRDRRKMLFEILKQQFAESTLIYIGYSNRDSNWRIVVDEMRAEFAPKETPQGYRIVRSSSPLDVEILKRKSIETLIGTLESFHHAAKTSLSQELTNRDSRELYRSKIPPQLAAQFDRNPAAVIRLLGQWQHVNSAAFDGPPNTRSFFRGDKANWGLISRKIPFERDVESRLYDHIQDYVTSTAKGPSSVIAIGPAGYGNTTLLMKLAARAAEDRLGHILFLREGQKPIEGDVEFAASFDDTMPTLFFVDDASMHSQELRSCIQRLRDTKQPGLFVLGSRLNQWHEKVGRPNAIEFLIEALSDDEIGRLLTCLSDNNELGVLTNLSHDFQFRAIKRKYLQELLVVMREATEGRAFDAIIMDEFQALSSELARKAYLTVSCFYQSGVYIRDTLLAALLDVPLSDLYSHIAGPTEGVIHFDEIDASTGTFGARTRHRTIASIVWDMCGSPGERELLASRALSLLNLNYSVDVDAFWEFLRSVTFVDGLGTLDNKIRFFESACQKDPTSPYVRQHYARMFKRVRHLPLALKEIDAAIELNAQAKALHHTRGLILGDLAMEALTDDLGRRWLVKAQDAFNKCITRDRRDDYGYASLAELYLWWAKRVASEAESNEYIGKAESVVSEGLKNTRAHEQLWIVSSEIEQFLGNEPARIAALENGLGSAASSRDSRYMLARFYRAKGRAKEALTILKPAIDNFPDDYRLFIEYALSMVSDGTPYSHAVAVLRLASLTGMRDPRYVATLGGMLFMAGAYTEAEAVSASASERAFSFADATRAFFVPRAPGSGERLRLSGKVTDVKPGYAFIDTVDKPGFFHHGTRAGDLVLKPGVQVYFEPAFSARGPVAQHVTASSERAIQQSILA